MPHATPRRWRTPAASLRVLLLVLLISALWLAIGWAMMLP